MKKPLKIKPDNLDGIAIIGIGLNLPKSKNVNTFWENICKGKELTTFFSDEELLKQGIAPELLKNPNYVKASPILEDFDKFDAKFFKYQPREAIAIDPQQRLLLQCAWETLEMAGYSSDNLAERVGVFAGSGGSVTSYLLEYIKTYPEIRGTTGSFQHLANDKDFLTTRISYKLNLRGPSVDAQTACSTSLVTVHLACQSILAGECEMALAGGVNVRVPHVSGYLRQEGDIYSTDGHCYTFDAKATGIVFGSGVGLVLLKPLRKAIEDGDTIYAVIKGSAINNDGEQKVSYTAASANGQAACMQEAFDRANITPASLHYIEAHGTGTTMGDPVEITALSRIFRKYTNEKQFCAITSVKTNLGHLDSASGIAGLIKATLALHHKKIPPNINFTTPNPKIDFKNSPFYVCTALEEWKSETPRRAAVNSLGMGGTNAFVVLEEAPQKITEAVTKKRKYYLFTLSAKTPTALRALAQQYVNYLEQHPTINLQALCYTLHVGRVSMTERVAIATPDVSTLLSALQCFLNNTTNEKIFTAQIPEGKKGSIGIYLSDGDKNHWQKQVEVVNLLQASGIATDTYIAGGTGIVSGAVLLKKLSLEDALSEKINLVDLHKDIIIAKATTPNGEALMKDLRLNPLPVEKIKEEVSNYGCDVIVGFDNNQDIADVTINMKSDVEDMLTELLAKLYVRGVVIDWMTYEKGFEAKRIPLPTYPFAKDRYWVTTETTKPKQTTTPNSLLYHLSWIASPNTAVESKDRKWLIITDLDAKCISLTPATVSHKLPDTLDAELTDIVFLFSKENTADNLDTILARQQAIFSKLIQSLKIILKHDWKNKPRLWLVTQGIHAIDQSPVNLTDTPLFGFYQTFRVENPDWVFKHVDLDPEGDHLAELQELYKLDRDDRIAFRNSQRYVAKLGRETNDPYQLQIKQKGLLKTLHWKSIPHPEPAAQQVSVEVVAASLNFRDLLLALGLYPEETEDFGLDLAGKISALGTNVSSFAVGDEVMGLGRHAFSLLAITDENLVVPKPANLTFAQAAAIPTVFLTAYYALRELAQIQKGDKVLIHSASGGLGLAAIQIAKQAGAEIYATVGNEEKRTFLQGMGIQHIYHSRDKQFSQQILTDTQGKGVNIVLNSLTGAGFIEASIQCSAQHARFIELAKRHVLTPEQVKQIRPDLQYHILAIDTLIKQQPTRVKELLTNIANGFTEEIYHPLPVTLYAASNVCAAFQSMQKAQHIGKLVVIFDQEVVKADHSYLVTGGLGGLGIKLVEWLVQQGAKHIVLIARRKPSDEVRSQLHAWQQQGVVIETASVDVSKAEEVRNLISEFGQRWPTLGGIIHAAGQLDDATLVEQTWERFANVWSSKVIGSWNLHEATRKQKINLDFFILYSSIASALGSAGQINYAAANAFLDGLAQYRQQHGLSALSVNWGPWGEVGMASSLHDLHERRGWHSLKPVEGLNALHEALHHIEANMVIADIDWVKIAKKNPQDVAWLSNVIPQQLSVPEEQVSQPKSFMQELERASISERETLLRQHIKEIFQESLGLSEEMSEEMGFFDLGLDSLMAIEVRNSIQASVGPENKLPQTVLFDHPNLEKLIHFLQTEILTSLFNQKDVVKQTTIETHEINQQEPIAVIGIACRFPAGANNPDKFWDVLESGIDAITEVPPDRWDNHTYYDPNPDSPGKVSTRYGGFLTTPVREFDAKFFNLSPNEAEMVDPQHRLLLELTWEALENAAIAPQELIDSNTGVYVGISTHDFEMLLQSALAELKEYNAYFAIGNLSSAAAGRVAYYFGLQGPSFALDTACSSSLVAVHEACMSLRNHTSNMCIAAGVNLMLSPDISISISKAHMLSPDGHCKTFDKSADGYVRSEGGAVVILKRLSDAKRDGDRILGLIRGTAINQGGRGSGITVPQGSAQVAVIKRALREAGLSPEAISYVEAHGTGTALGDPIEVGALTNAYGKVSRKKPLLIGGVKSNIGHTEAAAGLAGLIKVILAFKKEKLPVHLHLKQINPLIDLEKIPAKITIKNTDWKRDKTEPRIAGVSSFGFAGSNAHIIVEEPPEQLNTAITNFSQVVTFSAKSPEALQELISHFHLYIAANAKLQLSDIARTLNAGRNHFRYRHAVIINKVEDFKSHLQNLSLSEIKEPKTKKIIFIINDALIKDDTEIQRLKTMLPEFQQAFTEFAADYQKKYPQGSQVEVTSRSAQYAIITLLTSWGIKPDTIFGSEAVDKESLLKERKPIKIKEKDKKEQTNFYIEIGSSSSDFNKLNVADSWDNLLMILKELYLASININWKKFHTSLPGAKIALPTYPFQRRYLWPNVINIVKSKIPQKITPRPSVTEHAVITHDLKDIIINAVSEALGVKIEEVDESMDFLEMGMDSIMALQICASINKQIESGEKVESPLLYQHSSVQQLYNYLHEVHHSKATKGEWFKVLNKKSDNKIQLVCFPYAGGGASVFAGWNKSLSDKTEILLLELPGREARTEESAITDFKSLVNQIVDQLEQRLHLPFVFFGYSLGAVLAHAVANELYRRHQLLPQHLVVAAMCPPKLFEQQTQASTLSTHGVSSVLQTEYANALQDSGKNNQGHEQLSALLLLPLEQDIKLANDYHYPQNFLPLPCPLTVFYGYQDKVYKSYTMDGWKEETSQNFKSIGMKGNHFSMIVNAKGLLRHLNQIITQISEAAL